MSRWSNGRKRRRPGRGLAALVPLGAPPSSGLAGFQTGAQSDLRSVSGSVRSGEPQVQSPGSALFRGSALRMMVMIVVVRHPVRMMLHHPRTVVLHPPITVVPRVMIIVIANSRRCGVSIGRRRGVGVCVGRCVRRSVIRGGVRVIRMSAAAEEAALKKYRSRDKNQRLDCVAKAYWEDVAPHFHPSHKGSSIKDAKQQGPKRRGIFPLLMKWRPGFTQRHPKTCEAQKLRGDTAPRPRFYSPTGFLYCGRNRPGAQTY
jgi:hypothetical protein